MILKKLNRKFNTAYEHGFKYVGLYIELPGNKQPEIIVNHSRDIENKQEYYNKTYNANGVHNFNDKVKITAIGYGNTLQEVSDRLEIDQEENE